MTTTDLIALEVEQVLMPSTPLLLATLVDLAANARSRRLRSKAAQSLRFWVGALAHDAEQPDTFRGAWARRALIENAPAAMAYLKARMDQKKGRRRGKSNRASSR
jgi:hypothetical protein